MKPPFDKKRQLAEQIQKVLDGRVTKDSKFTLQEIELLIEQAFADAVKTTLFDNYRVGEAIAPGQFIVTFESVPVKRSETRNRDYIDIPARFVSLPGNKGLWSIGPMGNDFTKFIPVSLGATNFTTVYATPFLQGNIGYELEGLKAFFTQDIKSTLPSCIVQLVTASTDVDFNISPDIDMIVIKSVLQILGVEGPTDKVDDENETR